MKIAFTQSCKFEKGDFILDLNLYWGFYMIDSHRRPVSNRRPLTSLSQITVQF